MDQRRPSSYLGKGWSDRVQLGPTFVDALDETIEPGVVDEVRLYRHRYSRVRPSTAAVVRDCRAVACLRW
jgi:hypothetical protein